MCRYSDYGYDFCFLFRVVYLFQFSFTWSLFLFYFPGTDYTIGCFLVMLLLNDCVRVSFIPIPCDYASGDS